MNDAEELTLLRRIEGLIAENKLLREALKPFAEHAKTWPKRWSDDAIVYTESEDDPHKERRAAYVLSDLRRAASAVNPQETLRTSECLMLLRRWITQPRPGSLRFHQATDVEDKIYEWRKLVGDSEKLLATPINLGRTKEPKP